MAHVVTSEQQALACTIPERKRKHPPQMFDAVIAMFLVKMQDDFHIRARAEAVTLLDKGFTKCRAVVDLPVAYQHQRIVLIQNRLVTGCEIDDAEAGLRHRHGTVPEKPHVIRPPVHQGMGHGLDEVPLFRVWAQDARNSAHVVVRSSVEKVHGCPGTRDPDRAPGSGIDRL